MQTHIPRLSSATFAGGALASSTRAKGTQGLRLKFGSQAGVQLVARRAHCVPSLCPLQRPSRARTSPMSKQQALTWSSGAMQRRRRHHPDQRVHSQTAQRVGHHRLHPSRGPAREPQPPCSTRTARPRPPHQESPGKERPRGLKRPRSPRMAATAPEQRSPVQEESPRQESPRPSQPPTAVQRQPKPPPPRVRSLPAPPPAQRRCLLCRPQLRSSRLCDSSGAVCFLLCTLQHRCVRLALLSLRVLLRALLLR